MSPFHPIQVSFLSFPAQSPPLPLLLSYFQEQPGKKAFCFYLSKNQPPPPKLAKKFTASLGNLCQGLPTLTGRNFFPMSHLTLFLSVKICCNGKTKSWELKKKLHLQQAPLSAISHSGKCLRDEAGDQRGFPSPLGILGGIAQPHNPNLQAPTPP